MAGDEGRKQGWQQVSSTPSRHRYFFSALRSAESVDAALPDLAKKWQFVPVDRSTRELLLPDGVGEATRDILKVQEWIEELDCAIGVATGRSSGVVILRCRGSLGQRTLAAMLTDRDPFATLEGEDIGEKFFLFRAPKESLPSLDQFAPGLDFLGEEGYCAPLSLYWNTQHTELASLPDWLRSLVTRTTSFGLIEQVAAGDFEAINSETAFKAAKAYSSLGWMLVPVADDGSCLAAQGEHSPPKLWRDEPTTGLGFDTGLESGVVGLLIGDARAAKFLVENYGPLPLPRISGRHTVHCFRAPQERFPYKELYDGIEYVGEGQFLPAPPSIVEGKKLRWQVAGEFSSGLPDLPQWLYDLLSGQADTIAVVQSRPQVKTYQSPQVGGSGKTVQFEAAAHLFADRGWLVFPLNTGGKTPRTKNGLKDATRNQATISKWWKMWRSANIGVQTGAESGLVVLDVDVKNGQPGRQSLAELEVKYGRIDTLRANTPTGGQHLFFRYPSQVVGNRAGFLPGLDLRAQGGYVVAAPSRVGGKEYSWVDPSAMIAEMPEWLLTLVTTSKKKIKGESQVQQETISFGEALRGVQEGGRNDTIFRLASKLRQDGWEYDAALVLVKTAAVNCEPPLEEDEAVLCLESAWRYTPPAALTDIGNAERFVARCGDRVRYVQDKDRWLVWARHWWETNMREVYRLAKGTVRSLRDEAKAEVDQQRRRLLFAHSRKSESAQALEQMLEIVALELSVRAEDLDRGDLVAFSNGVFDPSTGTLRPGRREDLLTKHAPVPYDPSNPECLRWLGHSGPPPTVRPATVAASKVLNESLDRWLAERCEVGMGFSAKGSMLLKDFSAWLGEKVSPQQFGRLLGEKGKGFIRRKSSVYWYDGLQLCSKPKSKVRK